MSHATKIVTSCGRVGVAVLIVYGSWLGMLAVHELGHVVHAMISGGQVQRVVFPLFGFSQTIVSPNPQEQFVLWGGLLWGAALPGIVTVAVWLARHRAPEWLRFFAGFCLIGNGGYLLVGWFDRHSGADPAELRRLGVPVAVMIALGGASIGAGLAIWHRTQWLTRGRR
jgi:hypothetical protein